MLWRLVVTFLLFTVIILLLLKSTYLGQDRAQENYLSQQEEKTEFLNGIIEQETLDLLYDAIDELPERYRRIFELNFQQGLKNAEIAALLGVTESAVKKQKAAMIDLVRQSLKKKTGNDLLAF